MHAHDPHTWPGWVDGVWLAVCAIGLHAGCLQESSLSCADGAICPPGLVCAGDDRICILSTCGNGEIDASEACDDGNNRSGDGCSADCRRHCGDGVLDEGVEVCDDGNTDDADGCSADCQLLDGIFKVSPAIVAPYLGIAGRGGTSRIRGRGFQLLGGLVTIGIGDLDIGPVIPDSDTQITLSYPALPEGRYPVRLVNPQGMTPTGAELVIVTPPPFTYQAIDAPGSRRGLVYDAERQAIYGVNRFHQQIDRFVYSDGTWSALAPHIVPQLTDIAMTPNGRSLIVLDQDAINEISLTTSPFVLVSRANNPDPFCGGFFDKAAPANNGKIFVVFNLSDCSGYTSSYLYDMLDHSLLTTTSLYEGLIGASGDGTRVYAGSNGLSPAPEVQIFDSLTNTTASSLVDFNLTAVTVSGDASRVILQNRFVYSRTLTLTGHVPLRDMALASRDSSRAFVYVEDAEGPRLEVYNLNGPLQSGALYPLLRTVMLPDSANGTSGFHPPVVMTSTLDDAVVFVSGDSKLLVVPVE